MIALKITCGGRRASPGKHLLVGLLWACLGCDRAVEPSAAAAPERQFTLERVTIEERRHQTLLWSGTAAAARGDRARMAVQDVALLRQPQSPKESPCRVQAAHGCLDFAAGRAQFTGARIDHAAGTLHAPTAAYDEAARLLTGTGPICIDSPSSLTRAAGATLNLQHGCLTLQGPVQGHLQLPAPPAAP